VFVDLSEADGFSATAVWIESGINNINFNLLILSGKNFYIFTWTTPSHFPAQNQYYLFKGIRNVSKK
jgi:hypothetical protein